MILITNDDGYTSDGITTLFDELDKMKHEVFLMAPSGERSTCGHSLTLNAPLRIHQFNDRRFHCSGFPADCVLVSTGHFLKDNKPSLVISGINKGANLSQDIFYSSTVAGAREGVFQGIKSIAISLCCKFLVDKQTYHFDTAAKIMKLLLEHNIEDTLDLDGMININVPNVAFEDLTGVDVTQLGFRHYSDEISARVDGRDRDYYWIVGKLSGYDQSVERSDSNAIKKNKVSISYLPVKPHADKTQQEKKLNTFIEEINKEYFL